MTEIRLASSVLAPDFGALAPKSGASSELLGREGAA